MVEVRILEETVQRTKIGMGTGQKEGGMGEVMEGCKLKMLVGYVQEYGTNCKEGKEVRRVGRKWDDDPFQTV